MKILFSFSGLRWRKSVNTGWNEWAKSAKTKARSSKGSSGHIILQLTLYNDFLHLFLSPSLSISNNNMHADKKVTEFYSFKAIAWNFLGKTNTAIIKVETFVEWKFYATSHIRQSSQISREIQILKIHVRTAFYEKFSLYVKFFSSRECDYSKIRQKYLNRSSFWSFHWTSSTLYVAHWWKLSESK